MFLASCHMLAPPVFEVRGGKLKARKGVNVPTVQIDCAALTEKDVEAEGKGPQGASDGREELKSRYLQLTLSVAATSKALEMYSSVILLLYIKFPQCARYRSH